MKPALTVMIFVLSAALVLAAQTSAGTPQQAPAPSLDASLALIQKATLATNTDISKLRIEKWKTDSGQKQQLLQVAASLQKNITRAVPGLITDVQNSKGSVSTTFKLYHNLNVLFEFLSSLADAAGSLGRPEEYEPLVNDAAVLDSARQNLSTYVEQAASILESKVQPAGSTAAAADGTQTTSKKITLN
jgi:hypothetical protein